MSNRTIAIIGSCAVIVFVLILLVVLLLTRGKSGADTPEGAIRGYYDSLQNHDFEGMLSYVVAGFHPTITQQARLKADVNRDSWEFSNLSMRAIAGSEESSRINITGLDATVRYGSEGEQELSLVDDVIVPMQEGSPGFGIIVNVVKDEGRWKIANRPLGDWETRSLWVIGREAHP